MSSPSKQSEASHPWRIAHEDADAVVLQHHTAEKPEPDDWIARMCEPLRTLGQVVITGAKRLDREGTIFSVGEFVIHPKGFHWLGRETDALAYRFAEEVDAITGGIMAVQRTVFEAVGGIDAMQGHLGALNLCLTLRQAGGRCVCLPQVVVVDEHEPQPSDAESKAFAARWGFDWRCADLEAVQKKHAGSPLLWQVRFHTTAMAFEKYDTRPAVHWTTYDTVKPYKQRADFLVQWVKRICPTGRILDLGCGDGLFTHLFAINGAQATGLDREETAIEQARTQTQKQTYPNAAPTFTLGNIDDIAPADAYFDLITLFDVIEHLPNPAKVLQQVAARIRPGGILMITTPTMQFGRWSDPVYHVTEYTQAELVAQIENATGMTILEKGKIGGVYRDLVVTARKT